MQHGPWIGKEASWCFLSASYRGTDQESCKIYDNYCSWWRLQACSEVQGELGNSNLSAITWDIHRTRNRRTTLMKEDSLGQGDSFQAWIERELPESSSEGAVAAFSTAKGSLTFLPLVSQRDDLVSRSSLRMALNHRRWVREKKKDSY